MSKITTKIYCMNDPRLGSLYTTWIEIVSGLKEKIIDFYESESLLKGQKFGDWTPRQIATMVNLSGRLIANERAMEEALMSVDHLINTYFPKKEAQQLRNETKRFLAPLIRVLDTPLVKVSEGVDQFYEPYLDMAYTHWKLCNIIIEESFSEESYSDEEEIEILEIPEMLCKENISLVNIVGSLDESELFCKQPSELHKQVLLTPLVGGVRRGGRRNRGRRVGTGSRVVRRRNKGRGGGFGPKQTVIDGGSTISRATRGLRNLVRLPRLEYMCDSVLVDFIFHDAVLTHTNNAAAFCTWTYVMNELEDVTPTGNDVIVGTTAWTTFFTRYKVLKCTYSIDISNQETDGITVLAWPSSTDLGVNYSGASLMCGSPHVTQSFISGKGGNDRTRLKGSFDLGTLSGNPMDYIANPDWGGTMVGNVTNSLWLNVGGVSTATFTTGAGLDYRATFVLTTLLTGRKNLAS